MLLTFPLYAPSLHYPFVWYDADDLLRAIKYPVATLFSGVPNYQYYRPLIFTFWKLILNTWGADSAPVFHAYLIGGHVLNAILLYALTRALTRSRSIAAVAALLFTVYPFSYQAVTWIIAHQPPSLLFVLAGLLVYVKARDKRRETPPQGRCAGGEGRGKRVALHVLAIMLLVVSMLLHETGFVSAGLVVLIEVYLVLTKRVSRISRWPLVYIAATGMMYVIYSSAAKSAPVQATFQPLTGLYLLQGLVYPAAMLLPRVCQPANCDPTMLLLPVGLVFLGVLVIFWRLQRTLWIGLFGVLWFLGGILPMWAGRDFVYNEYAPRLLYLAGCGTCIAIAAIVGRGSEGRGAEGERQGARSKGKGAVTLIHWKRVVALGLMALILLQSTLFVFRRQGLYDEAFALLAQENNAMFTPREGQALFINTVELFTFKDDEFPLGWFGVLVSPWHNHIVADRHLRALNADWVIDPAQAQQVQDQARLKLEFHGQPLPSDLLQTMIISATSVYRVEAPQGDLHLFHIGAIQHHTAAPDSTLAAWDDSIRLVTATIASEAGVPVLNLDWHMAGSLDPNVTVFVHVLNEAGQVIAQADGDLIGGQVPIGLWQPNDRVQERRPLLLPDTLPSEKYTVVLGLYNRNSQQRLTPGQAGVPVKDNALIVGEFERP